MRDELWQLDRCLRHGSDGLLRQPSGRLPELRDLWKRVLLRQRLHRRGVCDELLAG